MSQICKPDLVSWLEEEEGFFVPGSEEGEMSTAFVWKSEDELRELGELPTEGVKRLQPEEDVQNQDGSKRQKRKGEKREHKSYVLTLRNEPGLMYSTFPMRKPGYKAQIYQGGYEMFELILLFIHHSVKM
ncbi:UNVERIFIED_CONTAM: hypothetical protein K2H54_063099, partial [Gekko kuhli]